MSLSVEETVIEQVTILLKLNLPQIDFQPPTSAIENINDRIYSLLIDEHLDEAITLLFQALILFWKEKKVVDVSYIKWICDILYHLKNMTWLSEDLEKNIRLLKLKKTPEFLT